MSASQNLLQEAFAFHQSGALPDAKARYQEILRREPSHFDALHMLGVLHLQTGHPDDALRLISAAVTANPAAVSAINNQGNVLQALRRYEDALASYNKAIAIDPNLADAHKNRGDVLRFLARYDEALASYNSALALNPNHADTCNNRGATLHALDRFEEALLDYERALALKPANPLALGNRGDALIALMRYEDALASYRQALALAPDTPEAVANTAKALHGLRRFDEALAACDKALAANPDNAKALITRGAILRDMQRPDEALASFSQAVALKPDSLEALISRGTTLQEIGKSDEALADYDRALALNPAHVEARWNRALALLMKGHFSEGWQELEWRLKSRTIASQPVLYPQPRWQGEDLSGKSLLIWGEQGVGDEILYANMVDSLIARDMSLVWVCDPRLQPLFKRSYPNIRILAHRTPPDPLTQDSAAIGAQISTPYLGRHLRPDAASFRRDARGYLKADDRRKNAYRDRLLGGAGKRLIGISWISKNARFGERKSSRLADWAPLWRAAGADARFVNLQYGDTAAERRSAPFDLAHLDDLDITNDLDGLAALVGACDLVITISNTTAHLAGALNVPVRVMIPTGHGNLWYWGAVEGASLWYPSATVFKQRTPGDWGEVIARVAQGLTDFV